VCRSNSALKSEDIHRHSILVVRVAFCAGLSLTGTFWECDVQVVLAQLLAFEQRCWVAWHYWYGSNLRLDPKRRKVATLFRL